MQSIGSSRQTTIIDFDCSSSRAVSQAQNTQEGTGSTQIGTKETSIANEDIAKDRGIEVSIDRQNRQIASHDNYT